MMSLLHEIHGQRPMVRRVLWVLSVFLAVSFVGFFWVSSLERQLFAAVQHTPEEEAAFAAQQDARAPKPLAAISRGFSSMTAAIGDLFGFDSSAGFDREQVQDKVYLLPLSK
jgi:hypothetical protein